MCVCVYLYTRDFGLNPLDSCAEALKLRFGNWDQQRGARPRFKWCKIGDFFLSGGSCCNSREFFLLPSSIYVYIYEIREAAAFPWLLRIAWLVYANILTWPLMPSWLQTPLSILPLHTRKWKSFLKWKSPQKKRQGPSYNIFKWEYC